MHALIEFAGKQYKVEEGISIKVPRLQGEVGTKVTIDNILYLEDGSQKTIGQPFIKGKKLDGEIISHGRGRKVVVFKFKRRKGYQTKNTHRDEYTILKIGKFGIVKKQVTTKKKVVSKKKNILQNKETTKNIKVSTLKKTSTSKMKNNKKEKE